MLGKKNNNLPNGGLIVIYHGRIRKKMTLKKSKTFEKQNDKLRGDIVTSLVIQRAPKNSKAFL